MSRTGRGVFRASKAMIAMTALVAVLGTACGGGGGATGEPDATQEGEQGTPQDAGENGQGDSATMSSGDAADDWDAIVQAAAEEGSLTYYVAQAEDVTIPTIEAFQEAYPEIEVEYLRLPSTPLAGRFAEEKDAGTVAADVIMLGAPNLVMDNPDWFKELSTDLLPNLETYPSDSWAERMFDVNITTQVAIYNTDRVSPDEVPTTWWEATEPSWQDRLLLTDPRSTGVYAEWALALEEEHGLEVFERMAALNPQLAESGVTGGQQVAAGAYDITYPVHMSHGAALIEEGAPIAFAHMEDVAPGFPLVITLPEDSPSPNAARVFANWLLSPEAQTVNCAAVTTPVHPDADPEGNCPGMPANYRPATFAAGDDDVAPILGTLGLD